MADRSTVETQIRLRLGNPPVAQLPQEMVTEALDAALREFSRYVPVMDTASFDVTAGVDEYDLPEKTFDVEDFVVLPNEARGLFVEQPESYDPNTGELVDQFHNMSDRYDQMYKDVFLTKQDIYPDVQVLEGSPPKARIFPAPEKNGVAHIRVLMDVLITDLKGADLENIYKYAEAVCLDFIGRKRSKSVTKVPTATGQLHLDDGKDLRAEARLLKHEFHEYLGCGATVIGVG